MKKVLIISLALIVLSINLSSQSDTSYIYKNFSISIIPPFSTNGADSRRCVNSFSLNLFIGSSAGLDGFEVGNFINQETDYMDGFQVSGFMNIVNGNVDGFQVAGFMNINEGNSDAFQVSGFMNINEKNFDGFQTAGFMNVTENMDGFQTAGFMNVSENMNGLQISSFMNVAENVDGLQITGFSNIAGNVDGLQLSGFMNVADKVDGAQISFLNICDSIDGVPIGFLSIVRKNGYRFFEISNNEFFQGNISYKIGVRKFYNIFSAGFHTGDFNSWGTGYGIGSEFDITKKMAISVEGILHHINEDEIYTLEPNEIFQAKTNFNFYLTPKIALFAGASYNLMFSYFNENGSKLIPTWAKVHHSIRPHKISWLGYSAGIRFKTF